MTFHFITCISIFPFNTVIFIKVILLKIAVNKICNNDVNYNLYEIKAIAGLFFNITYVMMKGP